MLELGLFLISAILVLIFAIVLELVSQKVQGVNNQNNVNTQFFSHYHTNLIKGITAMGIVAAHVGYPDHSRFLFLVAPGLSLMIIISGYGLNESYKRNGLSHFFVKRVVVTAIPYWILTFVMNFTLWDTFNLWTLVKQMLFIDSHYFWFMQFIVFQYICFFFIKRFIPNEKGRLLAFFLVGLAIFIFKPSISWGTHSFDFFIGYYVSQYGLKLPQGKKLVRVSSLALIIGVIAMAGRILPGIQQTNVYAGNANLMIVYLSMGMFWVIFSYATLKWKGWQWIYYSGRYSFNIYLLSWVILVVMLSDHIPTIPELIQYAFVLAITLIAFNYLTSWLTKQAKTHLIK